MTSWIQVGAIHISHVKLQRFCVCLFLLFPHSPSLPSPPTLPPPSLPPSPGFHCVTLAALELHVDQVGLDTYRTRVLGHTARAWPVLGNTCLSWLLLNPSVLDLFLKTRSQGAHTLALNLLYSQG